MDRYGRIEPQELKVHPANERIYGQEPLSEKLLDGIRKHGVIVPILVTSKYEIVSGHRRVAHAIAAETPTVPIVIRDFPDELSVLETLLECNRQREKTFTQRMKEGEVKSEIERARAKERQGTRNDLADNIQETFPESGKQSRDAIASAIGIGSGRTYDKAREVWDKAQQGDEKAAELIIKIDEGEITISKAHGEIKKAEREEQVEKQRENISAGVQIPDGLFDVIAMDPPWQYGTEYSSTSRRCASPYPEMSQEELLQMKVPFSENSIVFLCTTHRFLWDAKALLDHWGFMYKATVVWDKEKLGLGAWLRMQCEFCLVGIRGEPSWKNATWRDIIREPRREHSRKPEAFYQMVEEITTGRRLDFFSREPRKEWSTYGNDTARFSNGAV